MYFNSWLLMSWYVWSRYGGHEISWSLLQLLALSSLHPHFGGFMEARPPFICEKLKKRLTLGGDFPAFTDLELYDLV
jgi:hypothetical protein